jgi:hypothetical protein
MNNQQQVNIEEMTVAELWKLVSDQKDVIIQCQNQLALAQNNINAIMAEIGKRDKKEGE